MSNPPLNMMKIAINLFVLFFAFATQGFCLTTTGQKTTPVDARLTFETLQLPHQEKLGLAGGTFLYHVTDWFALGPATYSAITGQRGGFITLGGAANLQKKLTDHVSIDGGFFVGGGGGDGGYTLVGGGLMLRTHLGLYLDTQKWGSFGVGASYIDFPNGHITSLQPYFSYQYAFDVLMSKGWLDELMSINPKQAISASHREFAVVYKHYFVPNGVLNNAGNPQYKSIDLLGAEWYRYFYDRLFLKIESEGAMGGQSNGYMQILLGGGYRQPLTGSTFIKLAGQLGAAGGGKVYTGGGFLLDGSLALQQYLTESLYVSLNGGYTAAPTGQFKASSVGLQLGYGYDVPNVDKTFVEFSDLGGYSPKHLRIRATNQTYFQGKQGWRNHHADQNVNLLGLQIDYFTNKHVYLTGQGLGAYQGDAGAYMTGLLGAGLYAPLFKSPVFIDIEGLLGAAGGGGLDVSGGFVWQTNAGLGYLFNDAVSLMGYYGYISAPNGHLRANVLGVSLAYHFTLFASRPALN